MEYKCKGSVVGPEKESKVYEVYPMAANVETMAYFGKTPWHGFGSVLEESDRKDWKLVCEKSGLGWKVETVPVFTREATEDGGDFYHEQIDNQFLVRRETDKEPYAIVTKNFKPLQNEHALEWFQPWLDAGLAKFETAGALKNGAIIWALAEIDGMQADVIPGDELRRYVMLSNSHSGVQAVRGGWTNTRIVCNNTLSLAIQEKDNKLMRIRHSSNMEQNLKVLRGTMDMIRQQFNADVEQYRKLAHHAFYRDDVVRLVKKVVLDIDDPKEELSTRSQNILDQILESVKNSPGADTAPNTAWQAYNGINYFLLNEAGTKGDKSNRLYSAWFGVNKTKDQKVLDTMLAMAS